MLVFFVNFGTLKFHFAGYVHANDLIKKHCCRKKLIQSGKGYHRKNVHLAVGGNRNCTCMAYTTFLRLLNRQFSEGYRLGNDKTAIWQFYLIQYDFSFLYNFILLRP